MGASELISDFIGWLVISLILFALFYLGAVLFGKIIPAEYLLTSAGFLGLVFYGLSKGVVLNKH